MGPSANRPADGILIFFGFPNLLREKGQLPASIFFSFFRRPQLHFGLYPTVASNMQHGHASLEQNAPDEQPPMTRRRVLLTTKHRDATPRALPFQLREAIQK